MLTKKSLMCIKPIAYVMGEDVKKTEIRLAPLIAAPLPMCNLLSNCPPVYTSLRYWTAKTQHYCQGSKPTCYSPDHKLQIVLTQRTGFSDFKVPHLDT